MMGRKLRGWKRKKVKGKKTGMVGNKRKVTKTAWISTVGPGAKWWSLLGIQCVEKVTVTQNGYDMSFSTSN